MHSQVTIANQELKKTETPIQVPEGARTRDVSVQLITSSGVGPLTQRNSKNTEFLSRGGPANDQSN